MALAAFLAFSYCRKCRVWTKQRLLREFGYLILAFSLNLDVIESSSYTIYSPAKILFASSDWTVSKTRPAPFWCKFSATARALSLLNSLVYTSFCHDPFDTGWIGRSDDFDDVNGMVSVAPSWFSWSSSVCTSSPWGGEGGSVADGAERGMPSFEVCSKASALVAVLLGRRRRSVFDLNLQSG